MFLRILMLTFYVFFFFNDTATTEIYTLSLHDALPISCATPTASVTRSAGAVIGAFSSWPASSDRKSTRLNSSHSQISYAVFCLKKKKKKISYTFITALNHIGHDRHLIANRAIPDVT